jgi:hypothetical protein
MFPFVMSILLCEVSSHAIICSRKWQEGRRRWKPWRLQTWKKEGLLLRQEITHDDHPLSLGTTSVWHQFFQVSIWLWQLQTNSWNWTCPFHFHSLSSSVSTFIWEFVWMGTDLWYHGTRARNSFQEKISHMVPQKTGIGLLSERLLVKV